MAHLYSLLPTNLNSPTLRHAKQFTYAAAALLLVTLVSSLLWYKEDTLCKLSFGRRICPNQMPVVFPATYAHQNIAVASTFVHHFDVYLPVVSSLERVMNGHGSVQVYAPQPFGFNFQAIINEYAIYHGSVKDPEDLFIDIESTAVDMVLLGTCEVDLSYMQDRLLAAWDARDDEHKFQLVCMVHNQGDRGWQPNITPWARRNAIRLLTISEHVSATFWKHFKDLAADLDPIIRSAGYELIPIDTHIPIANLTRLPDKSGRRTLSSAVIQGSFDPNRRAYSDIFKALIQSLQESPESWGYLPLGNETSYIPDTSLVEPPFKLYLVGSGSLDLPPQLKNVVVYRVDLNYTEYFEVVGEIDLCIPALGPSDKYFTLQASATAHTCLEVNTPVLVTRRHRETYTYLDDDRVMITYPAVMTEIDAIRALRTRNASAFLASDPSSSGITLGSRGAVRRSVEEMMAKDWVRTKRGFEDRKGELWAANDAVARKLLKDLP